MIREGWIDSYKIDKLDANAERFFLRLCLKADDFGRFHAHPQMLKSTLFPMKDDIRATDMTRCLAACENSGLVRCYNVDGRPIVEIHRFDQRLRSKVSKFPECSDECQPDDGQVSVIVPPEEKRREDEEEQKKKSKGTLEEVSAFVVEVGLRPADAEYIFHKWNSNNWTNGGKPVKDWKAQVRSWKAAEYFPSQKKKKQRNIDTDGEQIDIDF